MAQILSLLTTVVNLLGLAVSLCLGLYIVTRTPQSRLSWLAAITLWLLTGVFLHNVLVLNLPGSGVLPLLRPLIVLALPLGFHLTLLLPPEKDLNPSFFFQPALRLPEVVRQSLGSLARPLSRVVVPLAYVLALALALGGVFPLGRSLQDSSRPAIYLSDRVAGFLYPLSIAYLLFFSFLAFFHLWQGRQKTTGRRRKRQYNRLLIATVLTAAGGLYLGLGVWLRLDVPSLPGDVAIGTALVLLGYTVARHNATVAGQDLKRDLTYISLAIGSLTVLYVLVAELLYLGGHFFSTLTLILIIVVAVTSLMLYDGLRTALDRLFYRDQFQQLRANLRALAREAGIGQPLPERLQAILSVICRTLDIQNGIVALCQDGSFVCEASEGSAPRRQAFAADALAADEITSLPRPNADNLGDMTLLVPIHDGEEQIGALVLGPGRAAASYNEKDLMLLDDVAEQLAGVIRATRLQEENARTINGMVADFREREQALQRQMRQMLAEREEEKRPLLEGTDDKAFAALVEDALRRLHDYPYLGEHPLVQLQFVDWCLQDCGDRFVTHLDRGKALSEGLVRALDKLRPPGLEPERHAIPSREWHQFLILHDAYVLGERNRDIMSRLYVGEGTFNRTRRRALRGVAKALREMEQEAQSA
jgi:GAF domain-containing protein